MHTFHRVENVNLRYNDVHYTVNSCPGMEMYETALKPHFVTYVPKIDNLAISWPFPVSIVSTFLLKFVPLPLLTFIALINISETSPVSYVTLSPPKFLVFRIEISRSHKNFSQSLLQRFHQDVWQIFERLKARKDYFFLAQKYNNNLIKREREREIFIFVNFQERGQSTRMANWKIRFRPLCNPYPENRIYWMDVTNERVCSISLFTLHSIIIDDRGDETGIVCEFRA